MVASTGIAGAGRRFLLRDAIFALTRPRRAFVVSFLLVFLTDLFAFLGAARLAAHFREVLPCFDVALRAVRENKMVTVKVREIRFDPGFCGSKPQGTVTVSANIQSDDLGRLEIGVQVLNQGSEELNIQEAHAVLQRFAEELANALIRPLAFDYRAGIDGLCPKPTLVHSNMRSSYNRMKSRTNASCINALQLIRAESGNMPMRPRPAINGPENF